METASPPLKRGKPFFHGRVSGFQWLFRASLFLSSYSGLFTLSLFTLSLFPLFHVGEAVFNGFPCLKR